MTQSRSYVLPMIRSRAKAKRSEVFASSILIYKPDDILHFYFILFIIKSYFLLYRKTLLILYLAKMVLYLDFLYETDIKASNSKDLSLVYFSDYVKIKIVTIVI